ncbi:MAG TPA: nucleotide disphospho-sugar-binding domain-containing protein [Gaiellaceae bacterium]
MSDSKPTVVFFPEAAFGPTNNCIGIGDVLRGRGYRVVFIIEESFAGSLEEKGFEERLMRLGPPPEVEEIPGQFWKELVREMSPVFRKPTIEQLDEFLRPGMQALIDGSKYVDEKLVEIFEELRPDAIVEDNVVAYPAIEASGRPWVRIISCNPLELKDPALPPVFSGYPADDTSGWDEFRAEHRRTHLPMWEDFDEFVRTRGAPGLPEVEFIHESQYLNLYVFPAEVDYARSVPPAPTWHRLECSVRETEAEWDVPEQLADGPGRLLYLSLGSLGSADVDLLQRLVDIFAATPYRVIVSKGPQHELLQLADNMAGEEFLPQTKVLPQVELVITHGGNNTVTECLYFGKPMVVLPLFWDQYDNAQRVDEHGFGRRLAPYTCTADELTGAIDALLADRALAARLEAVSARVRSEPGTVRAADLIEQLATTGRPVTR